MANSKLVVRSHKPHRMRLLWGAVAVVMVLGAYVLYEWGKYRGGFDSRSAAREKSSLLEQVGELKRSNTRLREEIALMTASQEVDREAYGRVEATLTDLQNEIQRNREELAFYRGIVSPADGKRGLKIQDLRVTTNGGDGYRLRLVLVMEAARHDRRVSGNVALTLEGEKDGQPVRYPLTELVSDNGEMDFSFRYFQDFDRQIVLPDGFTPERILVEVRSRTRSISSIEESFAWVTSQG